MARANLNIHTQINEEFLRANDSKDIRLLKVRIEDEILVLDGLVNMVGTAQQDFDTILLDSLLDNQASIVLFRVSTEVGEVAPWILIAWVPDGCRVRDKMLYSSSREDLKKSIGLSFFRGEYAANLRSDVTWKQFIASQDRTFDAEILTESERLVLEEKQQIRSESTVQKSSALGVLPFAMNADVRAELENFKLGACNWVEMTVANEVVNLVGVRTVSTGESLQPYIDTENASFIAVRLPRGANSGEQQQDPQATLFIFSCPENSPVRVKMTMSSSKASVLAAAQQIGVTFEKTLEIRDAEDVDHAVQSAINPNMGAGSDSPLPSSSSAAHSHGKPQRPGRGKAKVGKFKLDDDA